MKRFFAVLGSLLVLPAFAEVAPVYYDEIVEYTDDMVDTVETPDSDETNVVQQNTTPRVTNNRVTSRTSGTSRSGTSNRTASATSQRGADRGTVSRTTRVAPNQKTTTRSTASRTSVTSRSEKNNQSVRARVSANSANVVPATTNASLNRVQTVEDSDTKYISTDTSRVGVTSRRSTAALPRISTTVTPVVTSENVSETTSTLDAIAELTEYCQAQYAACMDNYCNVLDDNQGRCSCSKNLKNYQKVEEALATATENFQDTVQKIKYIGLTSDQVTSLFAETEAELQMKSSTDSSQLKNSLDAIKKKIIDATSSNSSSYATSGVSLDVSGLLNFDLASGFDLSSFLNTGLTNNSNTVSNQRGEQLYKTATARCRTSVLNSCTAQGIDASVITNAYDLEIDKQCIAYERSLNDANDEMRANVRNASTILQQARLMLAQNKNSYDFRGCVAAIDSCMQDDYVCGNDYELCLDPTGKYLSDGEIIKGGTPGIPGGTVKNTKTVCPEGTSGTSCESLDDWTSGGMYGLYSVWDYTKDGGTLNAFGGGIKENMGDYISGKLETWKKDYTSSNVTSSDLGTYLLQKIGYIDKDNKVHGMCASIMKSCQDYTYSNKGYVVNNEVVRQYLASTLNKIKAQQDAILTDYAEGCRNDVSSCLSTNGYDESNTQTTASQTAINACRSEIQTCMSVSGYQPADGATFKVREVSAWVETLLKSCPTNYYLNDDGESNTVTCEPCPTAVVVDTTGLGVSPAKSVQLESSGGQSTMCHCPSEYSDYSIANGQPDKCVVNSES